MISAKVPQSARIQERHIYLSVEHAQYTGAALVVLLRSVPDLPFLGNSQDSVVLSKDCLMSREIWWCVLVQLVWPRLRNTLASQIDYRSSTSVVIQHLH